MARLTPHRLAEERDARRISENFWRRHFDDSYTRRPDSLSTWDVPWLSVVGSTIWFQSCRAIISWYIGFGVDAVHTRSAQPCGDITDYADAIPVVSSARQDCQRAADRPIQEDFFEGITPAQRLYWRLPPLPIWLVRRAMRWAGW